MGEMLNAAEREVFRRFTARERPGSRIEEALIFDGPDEAETLAQPAEGLLPLSAETDNGR
jgi:hypothetical protein